MNQQNMDVLVNIIGAVESGGQVYGRRDYAAYAPPYTNSEKEYTITLGWAQNYGAEAKHLIQMIFDSAPVLFSEIDINGSIKGMLSHDWVKEKWNPTDEQKEILDTWSSEITEEKMELIDEITQIIYENSGDTRKWLIKTVGDIKKESKTKNQE